MSSRKKIDVGRTESASVLYQNKYAQLAELISPKQLVALLGRGSAKTSDIQAERLMDVIYEMPGAPCVWVADTFTNLTANILPSLLEGIERKGLKEGVHYIIEREPPEFTEAEKSELPEWLKPHFWKPFNKLVSYKRTMVFYTGTNIRFGSLDRPSTLAGASYVYVFGDEVKYFREDKISNLLKAVRGYSAEYGRCPLYRGFSFTTDMPDTGHVGEYDWILKYASGQDTEYLMTVLKAGLVYNEAMQEAVAARDIWVRTGRQEDHQEYLRKSRTADIWRARWTELRMNPRARTFFLHASSYINADILTDQWFADAITARTPDLDTAILSRKPQLGSGDRFYSALAERHFFYNGINESAYESFGLLDSEDCRVLRFLDLDRPLEAGADFGNMCSLSVTQEGTDNQRECIRFLKFIYTLAPEYVPDLGVKFRKYFAPMRNKVLRLYYDRAGNAYKAVGGDQVSKFKRAVEYENDRRTGWTVQLMSVGEGNINQAEEYAFMQEILGETNRRLPVVRIDASACKQLKSSIEMARTKVRDGIIYKDKSSERLPVDELPMKSTNPSDSFKYRLMTKRLRSIVSNRPTGSAAVPGPSIL